MSLKGKLVSVLLFQGLLLAVPLVFGVRDIWRLEGVLETLHEGRESGVQTPVVAAANPSTPEVETPAPLALDADGLLAEAAEGFLKEAVGRAARFGDGTSAAEEPALALKAMARFAQLWEALSAKTVADLKAQAEAVRVLDLAAGDERGWQGALDAVRRHGGAEWTEDPFNLLMGLRHVAGLREQGRDAAIGPAVTAFKGDALPFKRRLEGVRTLALARAREAKAGPAAGTPAPPAVVPTPRQMSPRAAGESAVRVRLLQEMVSARRHQVNRLGLLLAASTILALFFARILWNAVLDPLRRLRVSINNMAMSGQPSPVATHGPPEVAEVLQAYNRLIDTVAAEGGTTPRRLECGKCTQGVTQGDVYCRWCGFPMGNTHGGL